MRNALRQHVNPRDWSHFGLAYDMYAPVGADGAVSDDNRDAWFDYLERIAVPGAYDRALERWRTALELLGATIVEVTTQSRLLLGHGNPSPTEVGLTVHHTWSAPILPGSSLKGITHHSVVERYGPAELDASRASNPHGPEHPEEARAPFQPVVWDGKSIKYGPGEAIADLFGSPAYDDASEGDGAQRGRVRFLDGWWIPGSSRTPWARDVLTVHQRSYYLQNDSKRSNERPWPNDYDSPVPVGYMTVRPGERFLLAVVGDNTGGAVDFAINELLTALETRGIGGRTTSGYGRAVADGRGPKQLEHVEASPVLDDLQAYMSRETNPPGLGDDVSWRDVLGYVEDEMKADLLALDDAQRNAAADAIHKALGKHKKLKDQAAALVNELRNG